MTTDNGATFTCDYQEYDRETGALVECGEPAELTGPTMYDRGGRASHLCADHAAFVKDSTEGPFTKSKRRKPVELTVAESVHAMQRAYGFARSNNLGMPEDAGCNFVCGRRIGKSKGKAANDPAVVAWKAPMYRVNEKGEYEEFRSAAMIEVRYQEIIAAEGPAIVEVQAVEAAPEAVAMMEAVKPEPIDFAALEKEIHEHVSAGLETAAPVELSREAIEKACRRIMESKEQYKGTGLSPIVWSIGFRTFYQGKPASEKQLQAVRAIVAKQPARYVPLFAAA